MSPLYLWMPCGQDSTTKAVSSNFDILQINAKMLSLVHHPSGVINGETLITRISISSFSCICRANRHGHVALSSRRDTQAFPFLVLDL